MSDTPLLRLDGIVKISARSPRCAGSASISSAARSSPCSATTAPGKSTLVKIISGGLQAPAASSSRPGAPFRLPRRGQGRRHRNRLSGLVALHQCRCGSELFHGTRNRQRVFGVPILQERDAGHRGKGHGQRRHAHPIDARQCGASFGRAAPGDRTQPFRPLGRQTGAAGRTVRGARRRAETRRPRHDQAYCGSRASASWSSPISWRRRSRSPIASSSFAKAVAGDVARKETKPGRGCLHDYWRQPRRTCRE